LSPLDFALVAIARPPMGWRDWLLCAGLVYGSYVVQGYLREGGAQ
jgi:hypothetical protein